MKPGSGDRCTSKKGHWRCNREIGHEGQHQAKAGHATTRWN